MVPVEQLHNLSANEELMMTEKCTKGEKTLPLCGCPACEESRMETMRRVTTRGLGDDPYLQGDYDQIDSRKRYEFGE